jgi:hypothetical protein
VFMRRSFPRTLRGIYVVVFRSTYVGE